MCVERESVDCRKRGDTHGDDQRRACRSVHHTGDATSNRERARNKERKRENDRGKIKRETEKERKGEKEREARRLQKEGRHVRMGTKREVRKA